MAWALCRWSRWLSSLRAFRVGLRGCGSALLAASDLGAERVEALVPKAAVGLEPLVDLAQRSGVDGVETAGAVGADGREAVLAQDPQVLRHGRLGDAELLP